MALSVDGNEHVDITEYLFGCLLMLLIHQKVGFQAMEMVERCPTMFPSVRIQVPCHKSVGYLDRQR